MTEERSCKTCRFHFGNSKLGVICDKFIRACNSFDKWQPIQKAPSFQVTEEEARKILEVATILRVRGDMEIWIGNLKHAGYIRKSELVELVGEAEWTFENYRDEDNCITIVEALEINNRALQALKKDHPEFGGKK